MRTIMLFMASLLFTVSANAAGVNLVVNGSFEDPDIATGSWSVHSAIDGWSTTGAGVEVRDNIAGTAYDGQQFVELDSHRWPNNTNTNSSIHQTLNTIIGQSYLLSFAYSARINQPSTTNGISVFWNGLELDSVTATGGSTHNWTIFEYLVTGIGNDLLTFSATGTNDSLGGSLDAVSVSAVPIPAAAFLFAPALLGLLGLRRKTTIAS
ncbi:hypothetical protein A9Q79_05710 [Methylophaga sp. 42_25_T18]|nr:hypothetical protein A9Q79_05710 [Methylophaga sp. 42_25_T18]